MNRFGMRVMGVVLALTLVSLASGEAFANQQVTGLGKGRKARKQAGTVKTVEALQNGGVNCNYTAVSYGSRTYPFELKKVGLTSKWICKAKIKLVCEGTNDDGKDLSGFDHKTNLVQKDKCKDRDAKKHFLGIGNKKSGKTTKESCPNGPAGVKFVRRVAGQDRCVYYGKPIAGGSVSSEEIASVDEAIAADNSTSNGEEAD